MKPADMLTWMALWPLLWADVIHLRNLVFQEVYLLMGKQWELLYVFSCYGGRVTQLKFSKCCPWYSHNSVLPISLPLSYWQSWIFRKMVINGLLEFVTKFIAADCFVDVFNFFLVMGHFWHLLCTEFVKTHDAQCIQFLHYFFFFF